MADPISVLSGVIAIVTFTIQSSNSLYEAIKSFQNHPQKVKRLIDELEALKNVLEALKMVVEGPTPEDFNSLELPLKRCAEACKEFEELLASCSKNSGKPRTSFRDWAKLKYLGGDINDFRDTLAVYKSTISIALTGANLRASRFSLEKLEEFSDMIKRTVEDLESHRQEMDDKLIDRPVLESVTGDSLKERRLLLEEKMSTQKCLDICARVSAELSRHRLDNGQNEAQLSKAYSGAVATLGEMPSETVLNYLFQHLKAKLEATSSQFDNRMLFMEERLNRYPPTNNLSFDDKEKLIQERDSLEQCLSICEKASDDTEHARTNNFKSVSGAEDCQQLIVSTTADLINAIEVKVGNRSQQILGQLSDQSVQQVSNDFNNKSTRPVPER
ncbi:hypothetical protein K431DRAFT_271654 [Polychaeton citri CBS 116435]|uniref:Azaphilone pigments biosynthesis cluster protein L N-terminal domain-containing protein n=1 Tax=Polychaeton citri CBS 116435 TaxID=1314669 RepID=A0A9P4Q7R2_9PEZI|nr:hypothetical protein K431DRAFT_271654 [Polychaeton citri CBS 116435]